MADLVLSKPGLAEAAPTVNSGASGGDKFLNNGHVMMRLDKVSAGAIVVTIASQANCDQGTNHPETVSVPGSSAVRAIGPFPTTRFNIVGGADHGKAAITYDVNPPTGLLIELIAMA